MEKIYTLDENVLNELKYTETVEELISLAKTHKIDLTPDDAQNLFTYLHENSELLDEKFSDASGGFIFSTKEIEAVCPFCGSTRAYINIATPEKGICASCKRPFNLR